MSILMILAVTISFKSPSSKSSLRLNTRPLEICFYILKISCIVPKYMAQINSYFKGGVITVEKEKMGLKQD